MVKSPRLARAACAPGVSPGARPPAFSASVPVLTHDRFRSPGCKEKPMSRRTIMFLAALVLSLVNPLPLFAQASPLPAAPPAPAAAPAATGEEVMLTSKIIVHMKGAGVWD